MDAELEKAQDEKSARAKFTATEEERIRQLIDKTAEAVRTRDMEGILAAYSPNAVIYDVTDSLQYGKEGLRDAWQELFENSKSFAYEVFNPEIHADENFAFSFCLSHSTGESKTGEKIDIWLRVTSGFIKLNEDWLIIHEHISAPGDFESGKILVNLKPERAIQQ